jgi:hypothetical protein
MKKESSDTRSNHDRPLRRVDFQRHQVDSSATEEVPEKLRQIDLLLSPPFFQHSPVERDALRTLPDEPLAPYRPKCVMHP